MSTTKYVVRRERAPNWKKVCKTMEEARHVAATQWEFAGPHLLGGDTPAIVYIEVITTTKERVEL